MKNDPIEVMARAIEKEQCDCDVSSCWEWRIGVARAALRALKKWERQEFKAGRLKQSMWIRVDAPVRKKRNK